MIVEEAPPVEKADEKKDEIPAGKRLFALSGPAEAALRGQAARLADHLTEEAGEDIALPRRAHPGPAPQPLRTARGPVAGDRNELLLRLDALARYRRPSPRPETTGRARWRSSSPGTAVNGPEWASS